MYALLPRGDQSRGPRSQEPAPVGVPHDAVHEVVVHEAEAGDRGPEVQVDNVLASHALEVLGVAHPRQRVHHLVVPRQLVVVPARVCHTVRASGPQ